MPRMSKLIPSEIWQVAIEVETAGATEEETALLIVHLQETIRKHRHICKGFRVQNASVVDIHRLGEYDEEIQGSNREHSQGIRTIGE